MVVGEEMLTQASEVGHFASWALAVHPLEVREAFQLMAITALAERKPVDKPIDFEKIASEDAWEEKQQCLERDRIWHEPYWSRGNSPRPYRDGAGFRPSAAATLRTCRLAALAERSLAIFFPYSIVHWTCHRLDRLSRPLPSTNLGFSAPACGMAAEPSLESQAIDATLMHAQGQNPPTTTQVGEIVQFESGIFTAEVFDNKAGSLTANGATGGPTALSQELPNFFNGINDPVGLNPRGIPFTSQIFNLYQPWAGPGGTAATVGDTATGANTATASNATTGSNTATGSSSVIAPAAGVPTASGITATAAQQSIARGQAVFNNTVINITGVSGLNDDLNQPSISGFCGTCHDTSNHSVAAPLNIAVAGAAPPTLNVADVPLFTLTCKSGALAGQVFTPRIRDAP
jgi:hypothetical protein